MYRLIVVLGLLSGAFVSLPAATRGDVKVLEAADSIRSVADNLAREYMLYTLFPHKRAFRNYMNDELDALPRNFQDIAVATKDQRTKGLLSYFTYQKARADGIVQSPMPSRELAEEMLEMSRSFVEGSESIARHHTYKFSFEEKMFMLTRSMQRHLASLAKYYVARQLFPDDPALSERIDEATKRFEVELKQINGYHYKDPQMQEARRTLNQIWKNIRPYWDQKDPKTGLPLVLSLATDRMIDLLGTLGVYHSKNQ